ncbi:hypothetical protein ACFFLM_07895 [Deinococcus oregonensis]|uniref:Superoxide dismutase n=1 Tax=Deinococcus oregonensis TaxID=1805970 RepID=A0ABV6AWJ8_9DEIO
MKRIALMAVVSTLALSACNQPSVVGNNVSKDFSGLLNTAGSGYTAAAGTAVYVDLTGGDRRTILTATGLKANTAYISHYHSKGTAAGSTNDCTSGGPVVGGLIGGGSFTSDADGKLTIKGFQSTDVLKEAAYINIHEGATPSVIPLCADI